MAKIQMVNVFTIDGAGGNPCPIVTNAGSLTADEMQAIAHRYGHECGFVLPPSRSDHDFQFRFFVPNHEMEMCGHATIGALWLLAREDRLNRNDVRISTLSGLVIGHADTNSSEAQIEISQPKGEVQSLTREQEDIVLSALKITRKSLLDLPVQNARTSRTKTLIPMRNVAALNDLTVNMDAVEKACAGIDSTGLYPYAIVDQNALTFEARQFPRSSGYPEDAATGIAAAALVFGVLAAGCIEADAQPIQILQGRAMGCLSSIRVRLALDNGEATGCFLGGKVTPVS